jgi:hypothetical protein
MVRLNWMWVGLLLPMLAGAQEAPSATPAAKPAAQAPAQAPAPAQAATPAPKSPVEQFDALWPRRDDPKVAKQLQSLSKEALQRSPNDYGMLWRSARLTQWQADGIDSDEYKKLLGKSCWDVGLKAVAQDANRVEGQYVTAACIGAYSEGTGIVSALSQGLEGKFNEHLDKAISLNPRHSNCAPLIAKGRYFFKLPWPKRDLDKSAAEYEKAIKACPQALRAYLWLAETQLDQDHAQQAKATVQKALNGAIGYDPPEGRRVKAWAKKVEAKINEELQ